MKRKKEKKEFMMTIKIEEKKVKEIDFYAKKLKISRSHMVRNLIDDGMDDIKLMQSTGILTMALKGIDGLKTVKKAFKDNKFEIENNERIIIEL